MHRNLVFLTVLALFATLATTASAQNIIKIREVSREVQTIKANLGQTSQVIQESRAKFEDLEQQFANGGNRKEILAGIELVRDELKNVENRLDKMSSQLQDLRDTAKIIHNDPDSTPRVRQLALQTINEIDELQDQIQKQRKRIAQLRNALNELEAKVMA